MAHPGAVEHPEQHRVDQRPVRQLRKRLGVDDVEEAADLVVAEHIRRRPVRGLHACQRGRSPRLPAELAGVFGQFAQDDLLAADGGRFEVAAIEEFLDGFLDDRTVGVSFPAAVSDELTQHPCLALVAEPAGVACDDQRVDQVPQRQRLHGRVPCAASSTSSTSSAQQRWCSMSSLR